MNKCLVAVVVGHRAGSQGAVNANSGVTEYEYNDGLAPLICEGLKRNGMEAVIVHRTTYETLPDDINELNPDFILSLHCNSFGDTSVSGSETLYYHTSTKGKALATSIQREVVNALGLRDRGIQSTSAEGRGGYLLRYTDAPCVIIEPGFISNDQDFDALTEKRSLYACAVVVAALSYAIEHVVGS